MRAGYNTGADIGRSPQLADSYDRHCDSALAKRLSALVRQSCKYSALRQGSGSLCLKHEASRLGGQYPSEEQVHGRLRAETRDQFSERLGALRQIELNAQASANWVITFRRTGCSRPTEECNCSRPMAAAVGPMSRTTSISTSTPRRRTQSTQPRQLDPRVWAW